MERHFNYDTIGWERISLVRWALSLTRKDIEKLNPSDRATALRIITKERKSKHNKKKGK